MRNTHREVKSYLQGGIVERLCRLAFSLPFNGLPIIVLLQLPDEVPNDLDFLSAASAGLVGSVDDYLLHKLIDNGGREFLNAYILANNGGEAVKVGFVLFVSINRRLFCLDKLCQLLLFRFILGGQLQKPLMGNRARYVVLINPLENTVKFGDTLLCLFQFPFAPLYSLFHFLKTLFLYYPAEIVGVVYEHRRYVEYPAQYKQL